MVALLGRGEHSRKNAAIKTQRTCRLVCDTKLNCALGASEREGFLQGLCWNSVLGSCCCFTSKCLEDHLLIHGIFNNDNLSGSFI